MRLTAHPIFDTIHLLRLCLHSIMTRVTLVQGRFAAGPSSLDWPEKWREFCVAYAAYWRRFIFVPGLGDVGYAVQPLGFAQKAVRLLKRDLLVSLAEHLQSSLLHR